MAPRSAPPPLNPNPFAKYVYLLSARTSQPIDARSPLPVPLSSPDFNAGLEAAGYLQVSPVVRYVTSRRRRETDSFRTRTAQKLDTSEERITARFQHGLEKANFAAHSEEFCGQQGVRKVHRSVVQFFHEEPTPMDPFVHVIVGTLPPPEAATVTPIGSRAESHWVPIQSKYEAEGTMHFTVSIKGSVLSRKRWHSLALCKLTPCLGHLDADSGPSRSSSTRTRTTSRERTG